MLKGAEFWLSTMSRTDPLPQTALGCWAILDRIIRAQPTVHSKVPKPNTCSPAQEAKIVKTMSIGMPCWNKNTTQWLCQLIAGLWCRIWPTCLQGFGFKTPRDKRSLLGWEKMPPKKKAKTANQRKTLFIFSKIFVCSSIFATSGIKQGEMLSNSCLRLDLLCLA